jgi:hypothetical protein
MYPRGAAAIIWSAMQAFRKPAPHHPLEIGLGEERHLLHEHGDSLPIGAVASAQHRRQVGSPERAPRAERLDQLLHIAVHVAVRIGGRRACRQQCQLDVHVGEFRERDGLRDGGRKLAILRALQPAHVVHDQAQARMPRRDFGDLALQGRGVEHDRNVEPFRRRPEPIGGAVGHPRAVPLVMEGQPHAQHAGLTLPELEHLARLRLVDRQPAHDGEAIRMPGDGLERIVRTLAFP